VLEFTGIGLGPGCTGPGQEPGSTASWCHRVWSGGFGSNIWPGMGSSGAYVYSLIFDDKSSDLELSNPEIWSCVSQPNSVLVWPLSVDRVSNCRGWLGTGIRIVRV
jgi:hypothetical protein